jgi:iron complex outermembrane receptor protein
VLRQTMIGGNSEFFGGDPTVIATTSDFNGSETFTDFSPRVSLAWRPSPEHNLYASFSQGFKGGSFDPRGATTAAPDLNGDGTVSEDEVFEFMKFDSEQVDTWEIGAKSNLFDGRLVSNMAFFYSDYTDIQVPGSVGVDTDGDGVSDTFTGVTTNAGKATVKGFELEAIARLGEDWLIAGDRLRSTVAIGYIDAGYDEFITAIADPATGSTALQDVADQRVFQNTPEWTAHLNMQYDMPLSLFSAPGTLTLIGAWSYRDDTNQFEIPSAFLDQSAYSLYDVNLLWRHADGRFELGLHGHNLTNKEYKVAGYVFATPDGSASTLGLEGIMNAFFGPPRTITATARFNF